MLWDKLYPIHDNLKLLIKSPLQFTSCLLPSLGGPGVRQQLPQPARRTLDSSQPSSRDSYLALKRVVILQHVEELGVVNLEQHTSDLASEVRVHPLNEREQSLTQHLLLLLRRSGGQHGGGEWLLSLDEDSLLGLGGGGHHLAWHHLAGRVPGCWRVLERLLRSDLENIIIIRFQSNT